jgi:hypothetical protein
MKIETDQVAVSVQARRAAEEVKYSESNRREVYA